MSTPTLDPTASAQAEKFDPTVIERRSASVGQLFRDRVARTPDTEAFRYAAGDDWTSVTWAQAK